MKTPWAWPLWGVLLLSPQIAHAQGYFGGVLKNHGHTAGAGDGGSNISPTGLTTIPSGSTLTIKGLLTGVNGTIQIPLTDLGGQFCNVKAYGAVGDGVTDDSVAISSAMTNCITGSTIFFPSSGTYVTASPIVFTTKRFIFLGPSTVQTAIATPAATIRGTSAANPVIDFSSSGVNTSRFSEIRNLRILVASGNTGLKIANLGVQLNNVHVEGGAVGIELDNCVAQTWNVVDVVGTSTAVWMNVGPAANNFAINNNIINNLSASCGNTTGQAFAESTTTVAGGIQNNVFNALDVNNCNKGINLTTNGTLVNIFNVPWCEAMGGTGASCFKDQPANKNTYINSHSDGSGTNTINDASLQLQDTRVSGNKFSVGASTFQVSGGMVRAQGVFDGTDANAGEIGEFLSGTAGASQTPGASGTFVALATVTVTAGDWDIYAEMDFNSGGTTATQLFANISNSNTSADSANQNNYFGTGSIVATGEYLQSLGPRRVRVSSSTTYYLIGRLNYTVLGTAAWSTNCMIEARRRR